MQSPEKGVRGGFARTLAVVLLGGLALGAMGWTTTGQASETWVQQKVAPAAPGSTSTPVLGQVGNFGAAVALEGKTAFVGAPFSATNGNVQQGAVYVFTQNSDEIWQQNALLLAADGGAYDQFGSAIAQSGDYLVIGAPGATIDGNLGQGVVYVFSDSGGSWTQMQKLEAPDGAKGDEFGGAVAVGNGHILVGARYAKVGDNVQQGDVYDFDLSDGSWVDGQKLVADDGTPSALFGRALALEDAMAIVGAPGATVDSEAARGAAYVFNYANDAWSQSRKVVASDGTAGDLFGTSVALDGDRALIGAPDAGTATRVNLGKVYAYAQTGTTLNQTGVLEANDGASQDQFGNRLALQGTRALIGTQNNSGSFYLFSLDGSTWTQSTVFNPGLNGGRALALQGEQFFAGVPVAVGGSVKIYLPIDVALSVSAPETVKPKEAMTVNATLTNNAATATPPITLLTFPPNASTHASITTTQGKCNRAAAFTCNLGSVAGNGGSAKLSMKFEVSKSAPPGTMTNTVQTTNVTPRVEASARTHVKKKNDGGGGAFSLSLLALMALLSGLAVARKSRLRAERD